MTVACAAGESVRNSGFVFVYEPVSVWLCVDSNEWGLAVRRSQCERTLEEYQVYAIR